MPPGTLRRQTEQTARMKMSLCGTLLSSLARAGVGVTRRRTWVERWVLSAAATARSALRCHAAPAKLRVSENWAATRNQRWLRTPSAPILSLYYILPLHLSLSLPLGENTAGLYLCLRLTQWTALRSWVWNDMGSFTVVCSKATSNGFCHQRDKTFGQRFC